MLAFRRDFKEAAGVFAVGIVAVLLATPAGVALLRDTVASLFGGALMEVRSYRRVFDLERRIYRVDRLRLNPGGVPVRGSSTSWRSLAVALVSSAPADLRAPLRERAVVPVGPRASGRGRRRPRR